MNNFTQRLITSVFLVSTMFFCCLYSQSSFLIFGTIVSLLCAYEYSKMVKLSKVQSIVIYLLNLAILFAPYLWIIISIIFISIMIELFNNQKDPIHNLGKLFLGAIYTGIPFKLIFDIYSTGEFILSIFFIIWSYDTFAYLIGKKFGKTKLIPKISPKKTIEGLATGVVFSNLTAYLIWLYFKPIPILSLPLFLILANIICFASIIGDLVESMIKRNFKVKDSGNLLPGHGGVLDRFDSFIFVCPFIYIFTEIFKLL